MGAASLADGTELTRVTNTPRPACGISALLQNSRTVSKPRPSVNKRRKEEARKERQRNKAAKRVERAAEKANRDDSAGDEDPDIAGIVPGPQPPFEG